MVTLMKSFKSYVLFLLEEAALITSLNGRLVVSWNVNQKENHHKVAMIMGC